MLVLLKVDEVQGRVTEVLEMVGIMQRLNLLEVVGVVQADAPS